MPKKFISFLGAMAYEPTYYYFGSDKSKVAGATRFVQEAIIEMALPDWDEDDTVIIFTTKDAEDRNFRNLSVRGGEPLPGQGLEQVLKTLKKNGRIFSFHNYPIDDGNTEEEIWNIFKQVFQYIEPGDELYFDITYGFRSLPMLGIVLLDYARVLKDVKVQQIFYGNYEAGRQDARHDGLVCAPVLDLTTFATLQQWTAAADAFLNAGNPQPLAELTRYDSPTFSKNLVKFGEAILYCRGLELTHNLNVNSLKELVNTELQLPISAQVRPLLEKVQGRLEPFSSQNVMNGLHAVQWCIDNGLILQGHTFLLESIISMVLERAFPGDVDKLKNFAYREAAKAVAKGTDPDTTDDQTIKFLNNKIYKFLKQNRTTEEARADYRSMYNLFKKRVALHNTVSELTGSDGLRNDMLHCGFNPNPAKPLVLKEDLKRLYVRVNQIFSTP